MYHIFGLGNPGEEYKHTRHNVGRTVLNDVCLARGCNEWSEHYYAQAYVTTCTFGGQLVQCYLPETFMNHSGEAVRFAVENKSAMPYECIVCYDDIELPFGVVKIAQEKGSGGHNGLRSIEAALQSRSFVRIRIGIAPRSFWTGKIHRPKGGEPLSRYVLGRLTRGEVKTMHAITPRVGDICDSIVENGVEAAMNTFH